MEMVHNDTKTLHTELFLPPEGFLPFLEFTVYLPATFCQKYQCLFFMISTLILIFSKFLYLVFLYLIATCISHLAMNMLSTQ